ncbi:hypothetical protein [Halomonas sp. NO4]|uniref:hypothetical protein n=1 Tax=Halomonas sp. NO4 TaxID=2484813 RepID=UPI0013CFC101|nr:hypothetical protein [Halomonas sp. NO4]
MTENDHQRVIDELQAVIDETSHTIERFEATGMDEAMPADFQQLHALYAQAVSDQRAHTRHMLNTTPTRKE